MRTHEGPHAADIRRAYDGPSSGMRPLWLTADGPTPAARSLVQQLCTAGREGLPPQRYRPAALADTLRAAFASSSDADSLRHARQARADVALTTFDDLCSRRKPPALAGG